MGGQKFSKIVGHHLCTFPKRGGNKDFVSMSEPDQFTIIFWIVLFCSDKGVGSNLIDEKLSNLTDPKLSIWLFCKNPLPTSLIERLFLNESTVSIKIKSPLFILIIVMCGNSLRYIFFSF